MDVGVDGKTAYERERGKKFKKELLEFGECVHYLPLKHGPKLSKLAAKWRDGVFLGVKEGSDEMYVGTDEGVFKARSLRRDGTKSSSRSSKAYRGCQYQDQRCWKSCQDSRWTG